MSWLVVTVFSPRNDDPQFAVYEMNTLIQRADTEERALEYAYDRVCAFSAQFGHGTAALPVFQQCGTYHECNNDYSIGVISIRNLVQRGELPGAAVKQVHRDNPQGRVPQLCGTAAAFAARCAAYYDEDKAFGTARAAQTAVDWGSLVAALEA